MPDFARFLPLSQRSRGDESGVTTDRRAALADVIDQAAILVAGADSARVVFADAFADAAGLRSEYEDRAGDPVQRLSALARFVREGRRRSIRSLATGVRALLMLARDLHTEVVLDPLTAGSAALYASGTAPLERRAVVKGHTVRATDAEWAFGTGPVLTGTATGIAGFLLGVSDDAPQPVTQQ